MLQLITSHLATPDLALPEIGIRVDRLRLAKRLWRGQADDGQEFGFELSAPLQNGHAVWQSSTRRYVIHQVKEPLIEIPLDVDPSAAARIGWNIGNLHMELASDETRLLAPDDPAVRQMLERLGVHFHLVSAVFEPGRFTGNFGGSGHHHGVHSHGHGHQH